MHCARCGREIPEDSLACDHCGAVTSLGQVGEEEPVEPMPEEPRGARTTKRYGHGERWWENPVVEEQPKTAGATLWRRHRGVRLQVMGMPVIDDQLDSAPRRGGAGLPRSPWVRLLLAAVFGAVSLWFFYARTNRMLEPPPPKTTTHYIEYSDGTTKEVVETEPAQPPTTNT